MAHSLDRLSSAVAAGSAAAVARVPLADVAAPACISFIFLVERGDRGLLQSLDAAGILHDPGDPRDGIAGRRMAATGASIGWGKPRTAQWNDLVGGIGG